MPTAFADQRTAMDGSLAQKVQSFYARIGLAWLPVLCFCLAVISLTVSYSISQSRDIVITVLPFISDTGTIPPASCWFGLLLNATAYSLAAVAAVRFIQLREHLEQDQPYIRLLNILTLLIAFLGSLGMSMVAAFQETSVLSMHLFGAFMAFISAGVYSCLQNYLTYQLMTRTCYMKHKWLFGLRCVLSCICVVTLFTTTLPLKHAEYQLPPYISEGATTRQPYQHAKYYYMSTISEWSLATSFFIYVLTFCHEFSKIRLGTVVLGKENRGVEHESINQNTLSDIR